MPDQPRPLALWLSRLVRAALAGVILLVAVGIAFALYETRPEPTQRPLEATPLSVRTVLARPAPVDRRWEGFGTARAVAEADVAAQVSGRVVERPPGIEPGNAVAAGDLILRIDPTDYEQRVAAARGAIASLEAQIVALDVEEARLSEQVVLATDEAEAAARDLARAREVQQQGAGTQADVDQRIAALRAAERAVTALRQQLELLGPRGRQLEAELVRARSELRLAEEDLARTEIRSPIAGVLQSVGPRPGEYVVPGDAAARVVDVRLVEVPLRIPVSAGGTVRVGDPVVLEHVGGADSAWEGQVARVSPEADEQSRTMQVFVLVEQDPEDPAEQAEGGRTLERPVDERGRPLLLPGQFVTGRVFTRSPEDRLVVPRRAVVDGRVLVAEAGATGEPTVRRVRWADAPVLFYLEGSYPEIDPEERQWAVLERRPQDPLSLRAGMLVVTSNLDKLRPGMIVDVGGGVEPRPAGGPGRGSGADGGGGPRASDAAGVGGVGGANGVGGAGGGREADAEGGS